MRSDQNTGYCDEIPFIIQSFGVVIVLTKPDLAIRHTSNNVEAFLGKPCEYFIGKQMLDFLEPTERNAFQDYCQLADNAQNPVDFTYHIDDRNYEMHVNIYEWGDWIWLENEPKATNDEEFFTTFCHHLNKANHAFSRKASLEEIHHTGVRLLKTLTGFDKVVFVKLDKNLSGELVSADAHSGLQSYEGKEWSYNLINQEKDREQPLHYVPDVRKEKLNLYPIPKISTEALNLRPPGLLINTSMELWQHLQSIDASAYLGINLYVNDKLYGRISCFNQSPATLSLVTREVASLLGKQIAVALAHHSETQKFSGKAKMLEREIKMRRKAEQTIQKSLIALQQSNKELESFAYVASHDLQEPLRKIQAFGSRLKNLLDKSLDEKSEDYLMRMMRSASRMQGLINDLLNYARVTSHSSAFERIDLNNIFEEVITDLEVEINEKHARLEKDNFESIVADEAQLRRLFLNLVQNALKFSKNDEPPIIKMRNKSDRQYCRVEIIDNGIGFDTAYADKIFNLFERLQGNTGRGGSGLGLAICKKIVEQHNGRIKASGAFEKGAKFLVELPYAPSSTHAHS